MSTNDNSTEAFRSLKKRAVLGLLVWLALLALGGAFVSGAFRAGPASGYAAGMYLEGLFVSLFGLLALVALDVFNPGDAGRRLPVIMVWGALLAALLGGVGGIFSGAAGDGLPEGLQALSFLCLDVVLVALAVALCFRAAALRRVWAWAAVLATLAALAATIMGGIANWIAAFGDWPRAIVGGYAAFAGLQWPQWLGNLTAASGHVTAAALLALAVATTCAAFGPDREGGALTKAGLWLMAAGTLATALIYLVGGFSVAQPPILFQGGPGGLNGLAGGDLVGGLGVVLGGTLALVGLGIERRPDAVHRWGAALLVVLALVTVVGVGYYIQLHESLYGMGALAAPAAAADAVYTWFSQDFAYVLAPALLAAMLVLKLFVADGARRRMTQTVLLSGMLVVFLAGMFWLAVAQTGSRLPLAVGVIGALVLCAGVVLAVRAVAGRAGAPGAVSD